MATDSPLAVTADYFHAVTAPTPYVLAFVLGISFLLLLVAFRSLTVALVSIALNLLAVGAGSRNATTRADPPATRLPVASPASPGSSPEPP